MKNERGKKRKKIREEEQGNRNLFSAGKNKWNAEIKGGAKKEEGEEGGKKRRAGPQDHFFLLRQKPSKQKFSRPRADASGVEREYAFGIFSRILINYIAYSSQNLNSAMWASQPNKYDWRHR